MAGKDKTTKKTSKARSKAVSKKKSSLLDDIISAAPVAAKETKERYIVEGFEDLASRLRTQRVQLESLETEHKQDKKTLANAMRKIRLELECSGQYHSTLLVNSNDYDQDNNMLPVMAVFQDKYSKAPANDKLESLLMENLGDHYDTLFTKKVSVSLKKNVSLEALKKEIGVKAFDKLCALTNIKEEITPRSGFMEQRYNLRDVLSADLNRELDTLIEEEKSPMKRQDPLIRTK